MAGANILHDQCVPSAVRHVAGSGATMEDNNPSGKKPKRTTLLVVLHIVIGAVLGAIVGRLFLKDITLGIVIGVSLGFMHSLFLAILAVLRSEDAIEPD